MAGGRLELPTLTADNTLISLNQLQTLKLSFTQIEIIFLMRKRPSFCLYQG